MEVLKTHPIIVVCVIVIAIAVFLYWRSKKPSEDFTADEATVTLYYSPSCPHCTHFLPIWDKLTEYMEKVKNNPITMVKVNCGTDADQCKNVVAFPTIIMTKSDGTEIPFPTNMERSYENVLSFIHEN